MKITKIEQPQTGFVAGSGARPLSARLNAGAMAAAGQAVAQLGNTISNIGQQWLEKEVAIRNQAEVSKAKSHMTSAVETAREMVKTIPDPLEAERVFNRYVTSERQRVDKGGIEGLSFTTGSGKRTWRAETSAIIANGAKNVRTTARALMAETAVTNSYRYLDQIAVEMSTAPTTSDRDRLEREVRLEAMNLKLMGHIGPKDEFNLVKKYLGKADVLQVEAQLLQAEKNDDPEAAENVFSAIKPRILQKSGTRRSPKFNRAGIAFSQSIGKQGTGYGRSRTTHSEKKIRRTTEQKISDVCSANTKISLG